MNADALPWPPVLPTKHRRVIRDVAHATSLSILDFLRVQPGERTAVMKEIYPRVEGGLAALVHMIEHERKRLAKPPLPDLSHPQETQS